MINRHWAIMHGRSDFEIDEMDCIRLFNAVQSLCMIVKVGSKKKHNLRIKIRLLSRKHLFRREKAC